MTEASNIPETPLSLWLELFEKMGDGTGTARRPNSGGFLSPASAQI